MKCISVYSGRFQPFGKHHDEAFKWLQMKFGKNDCYIATSNKTNLEDSPFDFNLKSDIIQQYGISKSNIKLVKSPYQPFEITSNYNENEDVLIIMVSEKDFDRIKFNKKDGSLGYYQPYKKGLTLKPFKEHGYVIICPEFNISIDDKMEYSGTNLRNRLSSCTESEFTKLMGWFDIQIFKRIKESLRINNQINLDISEIENKFKDIFLDEIKKGTFKNLIENINIEIPVQDDFLTINKQIMGGTIGHISHIAEDKDLKFKDLTEIITRLFTGRLNIENDVAEKTDGIAISLTYKDGNVLLARNKSTIKNPLSYTQVKEQYSGKNQLVVQSFLDAIEDVQHALIHIPIDILTNIFGNGKSFVNCEILDSNHNMTLDYGKDKYIQFHGVSEYNESGELINLDSTKTDYLYSLLHEQGMLNRRVFKIISKNVLNLKKDDNCEYQLETFINRLHKLMDDYSLTPNNTIKDYYYYTFKDILENQFNLIDDDYIFTNVLKRWAFNDKSFRLNNKTIPDSKLLEELSAFEGAHVPQILNDIFDKFDNLYTELSSEYMFDNITGFLSKDPTYTKDKLKFKINESIKLIDKTNDAKKIQKVNRFIYKFNLAGGFEKLVPFEGIIFYYLGKMYKFTGIFRPVNQILGIIKYD